MIGYSGDCFGYLTTGELIMMCVLQTMVELGAGGSISNWMAIVCAIRRHRGDYDEDKSNINLRSTEVRAAYH